MGHFNWGELGLSHISLSLWGYVGRPLYCRRLCFNPISLSTCSW